MSCGLVFYYVLQIFSSASHNLVVNECLSIWQLKSGKSTVDSIT